MLYEYQKEVLENSTKNYLYALDTGTGKTLIALHHYYKYAAGKQLIIIAPAQKVKEGGWEREINAFIKYYNIPEIKYQIVSYQSIHKLDITDPENTFMILDECHYVKNYKAKRSKEVLKLSRRLYGFIGLSATMATNGWIDTINYFLMFDLYSNSTEFLRNHAIYELMNFGKVKVNQVVGWRDEEYLKILFDGISSKALKKEDCLDLPSISYENIFFKQSKDYKTIKKDRVFNDVIYDTVPKLMAGLRLNGNLKDKIDYLKMLAESTTENIVIFYNFQAEYDLIRQELLKNKIYIDFEVRGGSTRIPWKDDFKKIKNTITAVQIQAGGTGIELTYASLVIFFSPTWSYQDYEQALGRSYRNGQDKKVTVYKFIVEKTIDENVYTALKDKKDFTERLFLREVAEKVEEIKEIAIKETTGKEGTKNMDEPNNWQVNGEFYNDETGKFEPLGGLTEGGITNEIIPTAGLEVTENRHLYIGGSDLPALFNISDYKDQFELAQEKARIKEQDFTGNEYTTYGHIMEPKIRDYVNQKYGLNFIPGSIVNEEKHIRANYDGYDNEKGMLLEVKTNNGNKKNLKEYTLQMQLYLWALNVDEGLLVQYKRPEDFYTGVIFEQENSIEYFNTDFIAENLKVSKVKRNDQAIERILNAISKFWERVEWLKEYKEAIPAAYYMSIPSGIYNYNFFNKLVTTVVKSEMDKKKRAEKEEKEKENKELLYACLEAQDFKSFKNDKISVVRVLPTQSTTFDSKAFEKDYPELYKQYLKTNDKKGFLKISLFDQPEKKPRARKAKIEIADTRNNTDIKCDKGSNKGSDEVIDIENSNAEKSNAENNTTGESIEFGNKMIRWLSAKNKKINTLTNNMYSMWRPEDNIIRVVQNQNKETCVLDFSFDKTDMSVKLTDDSNFDKTIPANFVDYTNIIKAMPSWVTFEEDKKENEKESVNNEN